jgi:hypothetical protein
MTGLIMGGLNYGAIGAINALSLTSGLKLCLDAGDASSYSSGQSWLDLSGSGYDFNRGTTSAAQASDPTFNGSAGGLSSAEYWDFDGGDFFTYDSANETWMQNIHKDSAKFTLVAWGRWPLGVSQIVFGDSAGGVSNTGFHFAVRVAGGLLFSACNGSGVAALSMISTALVTTNAWSFIAVSLDEASVNSGIMQINAVQETGKAAAYTSPASGSASYPVQLGAAGDNGVGTPPFTNGSREAVACAWEGVALTAAQLMDLFNATRGRLGA